MGGRRGAGLGGPGGAASRGGAGRGIVASPHGVGRAIVCDRCSAPAGPARAGARVRTRRAHARARGRRRGLVRAGVSTAGGRGGARAGRAGRVTQRWWRRPRRPARACARRVRSAAALGAGARRRRTDGFGGRNAGNCKAGEWQCGDGGWWPRKLGPGSSGTCSGRRFNPRGYYGAWALQESERDGFSPFPAPPGRPAGARARGRAHAGPGVEWARAGRGAPARRVVSEPWAPGGGARGAVSGTRTGIEWGAWQGGAALAAPRRRRSPPRRALASERARMAAGGGPAPSLPRGAGRGPAPRRGCGAALPHGQVTSVALVSGVRVRR
jgi:hypothetical protein